MKSFNKPARLILDKIVKYLQFTFVFVIVAAVGLLMGEKSFVEKHKLDQKRISLERENETLKREIKSLERDVTLLRSDPKTIEKAAKRKLGMARPDETVYIFERGDWAASGVPDSDFGLINEHNIP